jgi:hypothetical protein
MWERGACSFLSTPKEHQTKTSLGAIGEEKNFWPAVHVNFLFYLMIFSTTKVKANIVSNWRMDMNYELESVWKWS